MTVIAWDGFTLAADKLSESGRTVQPTKKVHAINGYLVGAAGYAGCGAELLSWFRRGALVEEFPESNKDSESGAQLLVVTPSGRAFFIFNTPYPTPITSSKAALGCGGESALVAMHCGRRAGDAVAVTCLFNSGCGGGIDTINLDDSQRQMEGVALQEGWYSQFED